MNKKRIEEYLPFAIDALKTCNIANEKSEINKTFRGQISSFGAAVAMGSFKATVAFFSKTGGSSVERTNLIQALWFVTQGSKVLEINKICNTILESQEPKTSVYESQFLDASIALKLAMNAYTLVNKEEKNGKPSSSL